MRCSECGKSLDDEVKVNIDKWGNAYCEKCLPQETQTKTFVKADKGKTQWSLLPFEQMEQVVKVLEKGAEKYSVDNWKKCDDEKRYKDALMRHVISYVSGDKTDNETNLSHLAHAICNCLFLMYFDDKGTK